MAMEPPIPGPAVTARIYARYLQESEEAHSIIRLQNLSTQALLGGAIWGVPSDDGHRNILQPVLVSSTVSLREPFRSAARSDSVNKSTVNYSTLSKEILKAIASRRPDTYLKAAGGLTMDWSVYDLIEWIQVWLTGRLPSGSRPAAALLSHYLDGTCPCLVDESSSTYQSPLLDIGSLLEVGFTLFLPKATLLSSGVSLTTSSIHYPRNVYRSALKIHGIRIPTLIGVNAKERLARQLVIVSVEIDPYLFQERDYYNELEQIIFKTTEESSFETLESLATHLSARIIKFFIYAYTPHLQRPESPISSTPHSDVFSNVRICLEKPSAITFADAPSIEILRTSNPDVDEDARKMWNEYSSWARGKGVQVAQIPFPLQGTLLAWISENCPGDST